MQFKRQKVIRIILMMFLLSWPALAFAHGLVPCGGEGENPCKLEDIFYLIARVTNWLLMMAGIFAVFQIVNAGFWLVVTMGNEEKIIQYKKALSNAVVGFGLVMMAFLLVNTVTNLLLRAKCAVNLKDPMIYLKIVNTQDCVINPVNKDINSQ